MLRRAFVAILLAAAAFSYAGIQQRPGGVRTVLLSQGESPTPAPTPSPTPPASLTAHWTLDELSGDRADSLGTYNLADNATVGVDGASFAGAELLDIESGDLPDITGDWTLAYWFNATQGSNGVSWAGQNLSYVYHGAGTYPSIFNTLFTSKANILNQWRLIILQVADGKAYAWLDGEAYAENGTSITASAADRWGYGDRPSNTVPFIGGMKSAGFWTSAIDATARAALYDNGPLKYAELPASVPAPNGYWNLGTVVDSVGTFNDLTNTGPATLTGDALLGNAASFVAANNESLTHATLAADLVASGGISLTGWFYRNATTNDDLFMSIGQTTASGGDASMTLYGPSGNSDLWLVDSGPGVAQEIIPISLGATAGTWHFYAARYNPSDKKWYASVDDGTPVTSSAFSSHLDFSSGLNKIFYIGAFSGSIWFTGTADEPTVWAAYLSDDQITYLYGAGVPPAYPFVGFPP